jgi:hypothetical protein
MGALLPSLRVTVTEDSLTPSAATDVGDATTVELAELTEPKTTVTLAFPETLPKVAMTLPLPDAVALNRPEELTVPMPPMTDQEGVIETVLLLASFPTAANCCVLPDAIATVLGVTTMLAKTAPVALKITGDPARPADVAVTMFTPAAGPRVRSVETFPSEPVAADGVDSVPLPVATEKDTTTPLTGFPPASFTITTKGLAKAVPAIPL